MQRSIHSPAAFRQQLRDNVLDAAFEIVKRNETCADEGGNRDYITNVKGEKAA